MVTIGRCCLRALIRLTLPDERSRTGQYHYAESLVMMPARAMHVTVLQLFRRCVAYAHHLHVEM
jgi:hypothetical protein